MPLSGIKWQKNTLVGTFTRNVLVSTCILFLKILPIFCFLDSLIDRSGPVRRLVGDERASKSHTYVYAKA